MTHSEEDPVHGAPNSRAGLRRKAASGVYLMLFSSGATFVLQFATTVILARLFSPLEFGLLTAILVVISYADLLWQAGVGQAIIQKPEIGDDDIATAHYLMVGLGFLAGILFAVASGPLAGPLGVESRLLVLVALVFPLSALGSVPLAMVQRRLLFRVVVFKDVLEVATYGLVGVLAGLLGTGLEGLLLAVVAKSAVGALLPWFYARIPRGRGFSWHAARPLLRFGLGVSLSSLLNTTARNADYIVVLRTMDPLALGVYSRAYQLVTIPANLVGQVIDRVFFPTLSRLQADRVSLGRVYVTASAALAAIYLPGGALLYFLSDAVVFILLGREWALVSDPLRALALFLFFRVGYKVGEPIAKALGAVYSNALLQGAYTLLVFSGAFIGSRFGLVGVALGVGVALALNYVVVTVYVYVLVHFRISELFKALVVPILSQIGGFAVSVLALGYISAGGLGVYRIVAEVVSLMLTQCLVLVVTIVCWPRSVREAVLRSLLAWKGYPRV